MSKHKRIRGRKRKLAKAERKVPRYPKEAIQEIADDGALGYILSLADDLNLGNEVMKNKVGWALAGAYFAGDIHRIQHMAKHIFPWEDAWQELQEIFGRLDEIIPMLHMSINIEAIRLSFHERALDEKLATAFTRFEKFTPDEWKEHESYQATLKTAISFKEAIQNFLVERDNGESLLVEHQEYTQNKDLINQMKSRLQTKYKEVVGGQSLDPVNNWLVDRWYKIRKDYRAANKKHQPKRDTVQELLDWLQLENQDEI